MLAGIAEPTGETGRDDLAVRLQRDPVRPRCLADRRADDSGRSEGCVERPVWIEAHEREDVGDRPIGVLAVAGKEDLSVRLEQERQPAAMRAGRDAAGAEIGVEAALGLVPCDREGGDAAARPAGQDLSVRLERKCGDGDVAGGDAARPEGGIEPSVCQVPRKLGPD